MKLVLIIECEVYSRVVGYYRPVQNWNKGKQQEFLERALINVNNIKQNNLKDAITLNRSNSHSGESEKIP